MEIFIFSSWKPLINCGINLILTWSENCGTIYTDVANQNPTFERTETNFDIPVVTLSTQDNAKLLIQLKSGFKKQLIGLNINQNQNY